MGVRVSFLTDSEAPGAGQTAGVSLPPGAVQVTGDTGVVFVIHGDSVERRAVRLASTGGDEVTVSAGVSAGERVAVGDFSRLKDGARIRVE